MLGREVEEHDHVSIQAPSVLKEDEFVVLLRKACAYLVTNKGNVQAS